MLSFGFKTRRINSYNSLGVRKRNTFNATFKTKTYSNVNNNFIVMTGKKGCMIPSDITEKIIDDKGNIEFTCCNSAPYRNPLAGYRKQLDCSGMKNNCGLVCTPSKDVSGNLYKDNWAKSCAFHPEVCYNPVIKKIQNRNGYINDKYNYNSQQYLQRRVRLYKQVAFNFLSNKAIDNTCCANYKTAAHTGSCRDGSANGIMAFQDRTDCSVDCSACPTNTITNTIKCKGYSPCDVRNNNCVAVYKPSNMKFRHQGAVSGGSRINRLKYQTILTSQSSYKNKRSSSQFNTTENAYGSINTNGGVNATNGAYPAMLYRSTGPTFKRNLVGPCMVSKSRTFNNNKQRCFVKKCLCRPRIYSRNIRSAPK